MNHQKSLLTHIREAGLLEDFIDICTPDVTAERAMQWLRRRPQLLERVKYWPKLESVKSIRRQLGCSAATGGDHGGNDKKGKKEIDIRGRKLRKKVTFISESQGHQTPKRIGLEWESPLHE